MEKKALTQRLINFFFTFYTFSNFVNLYSYIKVFKWNTHRGQPNKETKSKNRQMLSSNSINHINA